MYTIIVRILDYGYGEAKRMTFTSVAAIIISAFIELVAKLMMDGFVAQTFKEFSYYLFSSVGTIIGVWVMVIITIQCHKKNISSYLIIPFAIIPASIIHSIFFFGGMALVNWQLGVYTAYQALGTIIGKGVCILLSIFCYFINKNYWKPFNLVEKEEKIDNESKD